MRKNRAKIKKHHFCTIVKKIRFYKHFVTESLSNNRTIITVLDKLRSGDDKLVR